MGDREKGSVLVLVMVSVVALFVLGTVLAGTGSTEIRETARQEYKMQAYYLARSGAEAVACCIIKEPEKAEEITGQGFSDQVGLGRGTFEVKVEQQGEQELLITSVGNCDRMKETVTLTLVKTNVSVDVLFDRVIFSNSDLDISHTNAHAYGDVESRGAIIGAPEEGFEVFPYSDRIYPSPTFPEDIASTTNQIQVGNGQNLYIDDDCYLKAIDVEPGGTLTVFTGGHDVRVVAETVYLKGNLVVEGGGRLLLFVYNHAELQTPHASTAGSLIVFMHDNSTATLIANAEFSGYIYGPKATVILQSKQTKVYGAIIADRVVKNEGGNPFQGTLYYHEEVDFDPEELAPYISYTTYQRGAWK